ncbi:MAG TPA: hypothetical protein PKM88_07895 [bacterium]|nr:hypothetical protein [bacterium]
MKPQWQRRVERLLEPLAVPNVTGYLVGMQFLCLIVAIARPALYAALPLQAGLVLQGEWWRLISFVAIPPTDSMLWAAFAWYLFWLMGTALEGHWGTIHYNLFLLTGWLATVAAAFIIPDAEFGNLFIGGAVFLAFARLYPEFELALFFVLPVKIKWLARLTWLMYGLSVLLGDWPQRLMVLAATGNYLLFFGRDIWLTMRSREWRMRNQAAAFVVQHQARHTCAVCGITDKTHPRTDFRYCSGCKPARAYCPEHLPTHEHRRD